MENNPEKVIREACILANPDILKLEFGCICAGKYASETNPDKYFYHYGGHLGHGFSLKTGHKVQYRNTTMPDGSSSIEILGRPIRLADVLLAIGNKEKFYFKEPSSVHSTHLMLCFVNPIGHIHWNLKQDDLSLQSDETKQFLATLL